MKSISDTDQLHVLEATEASSDQGNKRPGLSWVKEFHRTRKRPLRVLHIGNIANNGYNNAKIQRQHGIEADVICYDYYHVMGCPEWEDAEFDGVIRDPFSPDWWGVSLNGFARPRWFAQGPWSYCVKYLVEKADGNPIRTRYLWFMLGSFRWIKARDTWYADLIRRAVEGVRHAGRELTYWVLWSLQAIRGVLYRFSSRSRRLFYLAIAGKDGSRSARWIRTRRRLSASGVNSRWLRPVVLTILDALCWILKGLLLSYHKLREGMRGLGSLFRDRVWHRKLNGWGSKADKNDVLVIPDEIRKDVVPYLAILPGWHALMAKYDFVQAYSTDPLYPALLDMRNFAAYEHGTIRQIPFEDNPQGRLCAFSYRRAPVVFVTNSDNLLATEKLNLRPEQVVCLPHAFDDDKVRRYGKAKKAQFPMTTEPVLFFAPARHHWVSGEAGWCKGNHLIIKAAAQLIAEGRQFRLRFVEWGMEVKESKALIQELGCGNSIEWVPQMKKRQLWDAYLGATAVLDQFVIPAIGGVTFEAMCLGKRVITFIDEHTVKRFFGVLPPLLNAGTEGQVADAMRAVLDDPADGIQLGDAASDWIKEFHSAEYVVDVQAQAYRRLLS